MCDWAKNRFLHKITTFLSKKNHPIAFSFFLGPDCTKSVSVKMRRDVEAFEREIFWDVIDEWPFRFVFRWAGNSYIFFLEKKFTAYCHHDYLDKWMKPDLSQWNSFIFKYSERKTDFRSRSQSVNHPPTNMLTYSKLRTIISGSAGRFLTSVWISSLHIQTSLETKASGKSCQNQLNVPQK